MPTATLCTFNVNNLFLRYRFGRSFPGDRSADNLATDPREGFLPLYTPGSFSQLKPEQRQLGADVLRLPDGTLPDILCVQEVESLLALRLFNEESLGGHYAHAALIDSRDLRQIDVGILSTRPIVSLRTHVDMTDPDDTGFPWLFSRDCLEVTIALNKSGSKTLTVFNNHFKSKFTDAKTPEARAEATRRANDKRQRQATAVRKLLRERFAGDAYGKALFAVTGDLNDGPQAATLAPLLKDARLTNVLGRLPSDERWTHYYKSAGDVMQFDYLLLSPALARAARNGELHIDRRGIGFRELSRTDQQPLPRQVELKTADDQPATPIDFRFARDARVTAKLSASDHCPVTIAFGF